MNVIKEIKNRIGKIETILFKKDISIEVLRKEINLLKTNIEIVLDDYVKINNTLKQRLELYSLSKSLSNKSNQKIISAKDLIFEISNYLGIDVKKEVRKKEYIFARAFICNKLYNEYNLNYEQILKLLNKKSHATIKNSIETYQNFIDIKNEEFITFISDINEYIKMLSYE